MKIQGEIYLIR